MLLAYLSGLFTRKFAEALVDYIPADKNLASLTKTELEDIAAQLLHGFKVKPAGTKGYDKAEVMTGGVDTNELSSKTLEAKKVPGLFLAASVLMLQAGLAAITFNGPGQAGL
jgi:predicted flavoprotein YhiN